MKKPGFKSMIAFAIMMVAGFCNVALGQDFNGTWEGQVACEENLEAIKRLVPHATVKPYEGLNHFFQTCSGWVGSTQYAVIRETMAPQVLEDIVNWLQDVTRQ